MGRDSAEEFLKSVRASGLVPPDDLATFSQRQLTGDVATAADVAARLVEHKLVTEYQADRLLAGRGGDCVIGDRYRIVEQLGSGGMGTVYRAQDTKLDRPVAIKVLPEHSVSDRDAVARFDREAKALAKLAHPNIVQAYDSGSDRGRHFLVMECVEGRSLAQMLRDHGRLPPTVAADYAYQAALGLEHAHERGLVHRDLKPSNLFLTGDRQIKILDLGLARFLQDQVGDSTITREGAGMGTPDYMAPEQFHDARHVDARSDIYALGCTLYHLLTGSVPFPGSSLSEKFESHQSREPAPIEQSCPEIPAGLALVVARMMGKRPADRFQSARDVSEALAPYVAGSSYAILHLKRSASWDGSALALSVARTYERRRRRWMLGSVGTVAAAALAGFAFWAGGKLVPDRRPPHREPVVSAPGGAVVTTTEPADPAVRTVAQDGSGQFRSIGEALDQGGPGMTIRILDNATYDESISLTSAASHRGIRIESPRRATLAVTANDGMGIRISHVPGVVVSGLRLRAEAARVTLIRLEGRIPGTTLRELEFDGKGADYEGMQLFGLDLADDEPPVVIDSCIFRRGKWGLLGWSGEAVGKEGKCSRVVVRGCKFTDMSHFGMLFGGDVRAVQIVGNRFCASPRFAAIQLESLAESSGSILVANNTFFDCAPAVRLWDTAPRDGAVELHGNLILGAAQPDVLFLQSDGTRQGLVGPGDPALVHARWKLTSNWREVKQPAGDDLLAKSWVAPGPADRRMDEIAVLSRDPNSADFLRPAADSPLAGGGAASGQDLPAYAGAVAPPGIEPWDWNKTWLARHPNTTLTVSQDPKDGGEFRSIAEAIEQARAGATIRVLDQATYRDEIILEDPQRHAGIRFVATNQATIMLGAHNRRAFTIRGVAGVTIEGFKIRSEGTGPQVTAAVVSGNCPGVRFDRLDIRLDGDGIIVQNAIATDESPLVISRCHIEAAMIGVHISGGTGSLSGQSRCIVVHGNRVTGGYRAIQVRGHVSDIQIAGNAAWNSEHASLQLEDLATTARRVLIVNNTAWGSRSSFRVWDDPPYQAIEPGQVELCNNIFVDAIDSDMSAARGLEAGIGSAWQEGGIEILRAWRLERNHRDLSGTEVSIPLGDKDVQVVSVAFRSRDPNHRDFLRPPADSPVASGGVGGTLPTYAGAVPPDNVEPWDWEATWKTLVQQRPATATP